MQKALSFFDHRHQLGRFRALGRGGAEWGKALAGILPLGRAPHQGVEFLGLLWRGGQSRADACQRSPLFQIEYLKPK